MLRTSCPQDKLSDVRKADSGELPPDPEERVGRVLELSEDLGKRTKICTNLEDRRRDLFPAEGEKMSKDAKEFLERLKQLRTLLTNMEDEAQKDFDKYSEYQAGLQVFYPKLLNAEDLVNDGISIPQNLDTARELEQEYKRFLEELAFCQDTLNQAEETCKGMTFHQNCLDTIDEFRTRTLFCLKVAEERMALITELAESWTRLEQKADKLSSIASAETLDIPLENIEEHLNNLKDSFKEKQALITDMETRYRKLEVDRKTSVEPVPGAGANRNRRMTVFKPSAVRKPSVMPPAQQEKSSIGL